MEIADTKPNRIALLTSSSMLLSCSLFPKTAAQIHAANTIAKIQIISVISFARLFGFITTVCFPFLSCSYILKIISFRTDKIPKRGQTDFVYIKNPAEGEIL